MSGFRWRDGERTVVYGPGAAGRLEEFGWTSFQVVTTARADPGLGEALHVGPGQVPELAAGLLERVTGERLVAWGGGRVIDVAKALGSARGLQVCAVPTTLSGAEMNGGHRQIAGYEHQARVRPALVLADPALMTSLPEPELTWSAMNALAHAMEALVTPDRNPVASLAALRAGRLLVEGDRALGSLVAGYALDSTGFAVHHVLCQSVVRVCGTPHARTNAALLPRTHRFLAERAGELLAGFPQPPVTAAVEVTAERAAVAVDAALARPELARTPGPPVTRAELAGLLGSDEL